MLLSSLVLGGIADAVEALGFVVVANGDELSLPEGIQNGLRQEAGLFDPQEEGQADEF